MTKKRALAAILIVCVLAIAFFWGGFDGKGNQPAKPAGGSNETQTLTQMAPNSAPSEEDKDKQSEGLSENSSEKPIENPNEKPTEEPTGKLGEEINGAEQGQVQAEVVTTDPGTKADEANLDEAKAGTTDPDAPKSGSKPTKPESSAETKNKEAQTEQEPKKDKYQTDPIPEGKPKPVEWQDVTINKKTKLTATLSVSAKTILDNMDQFNPDKLEVLPEDGVIYKSQTVTFYEGESVFDVLLREMKSHKIHMEFSMTPIYNSNYVEGINNLYEFDCGELSGWMYKVNGWFPNYGSSRYVLQDGDVIEWVYTCDLGRDVGGDFAVTGARQQ